MSQGGKLHNPAEGALAGLSALAAAVMAASAALYVLLDSPAHGALLVFAGLALAAGLCALARLASRADARALGCAVFFAALALRLAALGALHMEPESDFLLLYDAACRFAAGDKAAFAGEYFALWGYQIPFALYEALVVRLGGGAAALGALNALWGALIAALVFGLARRFAGEGPAAAVGLLYACWPAALLLTPVLTNQFVSLAFILMGVFLASAGGLKRSALGGAALALGNLMRPEAALALLGLAAALVVRLAGRRGEWKRALSDFAALLAGYIALTALFTAAARASGIAPNGLGNAAPEWKFVLGLDTATRGEYDAGMEYILEIADPAARRAAALEAIRASLEGAGGPGGLIAFFAEKTAAFWGAYEESWLGLESGAAYFLRRCDRAFFIAAALLAVPGCARLRASAEENAARGALLACFAAYLVIETQSRYRCFAAPLLLILAAAGIKRLLPYGQGRRKRV